MGPIAAEKGAPGSVSSGDCVSFVVEGNTVQLVNSAVYAMQVFQSEMRGEAERAGLASDEGVIALVKELRDGNGGA